MTTMQLSYCHRGGEQPLLGDTIPGHLDAVAGCFPQNEAVVSVAQQRRLSYAELQTGVESLARGLLGCGFNRGDRIGIWSTNNIEWLLLQLATARIGAILVNINPAYRSGELAYALQRAAVNGLFMIPGFRSSNYVDLIAGLLPELADSAAAKIDNPELPSLRRVVIFDPAAPGQSAAPLPGFTTWADVLAAGESISPEQLAAVTDTLDRDDPINIQYTSGTTGFPKAVLLSHHNILNNAWFAAQAMHFTAVDRLAVPVPFYHCFGMVLANLLCLSVGACIVIPAEHFDAAETLKAVEREQCTAIHGVPTMFIAALELPSFRIHNLESLRTGIMAGAPCPPALMQRVMSEMHCSEILIGYGETEASPLTHLTTREDSLERRVETVGTNLPHQEVKVVDVETRRSVPLGTVGEICFRGYHIMHGYYGDSEASARAIDDRGWLASGDLGTMDADGYVRITGRLKEMIIRGGENIYPREIEDHIFTHPKVAEVAVFGIPDDYYGEQVMAWVQLHEGETADADEIRDFCRKQLAHFKVPEHVWFVDEFPMTVTGKLQKYRMRELALEQLGLAAQQATSD